MAGNQWMMNKNSQQLIEINESLLKEIGPVENGHVHIEALVFANQANQSQLYHLAPAPDPDDWSAASDIVINSPAAKMRIGIVDVGPNASGQIDTPSGIPTVTEGKALSEFDNDFPGEHEAIKAILDQHPDAKYLDLKGAGIDIDFNEDTDWNKPQYLIYW
jgi:hypothetical protein